MRREQVRKMIAGAFILAMSIVLIVGCSSGNNSSGNSASTSSTSNASSTNSVKDTPAKQVQLKIWGGVPAESGPDLVMEAFNKEFADKGITATYERFVNDDSGNLKLDTALLSGNDVDLFVNYSIPKLKQRVESGMAIDLSDFIARDGFDLKQNFGEIVEKYYVNEKPYAIPTYAYKYSFLVNKDIFEANNIPIPTAWTIDEFRETVKKLTKGSGTDKTYGAFLSLDSQKYLPALVVGTKTGGDYFYKNGSDKETDFDNPLYHSVLQTFVDMMLVDGTIVPYSDIITQKLSAINMFVSGKVAISDAYWTVRDLKDKEKYPHEFETAFVPMPTAEKMTRDESFVSGGYMDYFSINSKSQNQEAAWVFLKWYATGGMEPMVPFGRTPASVNFDKNVVAQAFSKGVEDLFDMESYGREITSPEKQFQISTISTELPEITKIISEEFERAYIGDKDVASALADAKIRADEILNK